jgi:type III restriction enzyme
LSAYVERAAERMYDAIEPDDDQGEPPLLPMLNRYKPVDSTKEVDFKATRPCYIAIKSHVNQVVLDTST